MTSHMTVHELKEALSRMNLPVYGKKDELRGRLRKALTAQKLAEEERQDQINSNGIPSRPRKAREPKYRRFLVVDVEATCIEGEKGYEFPNESESKADRVRPHEPRNEQAPWSSLSHRIARRIARAARRLYLLLFLVQPTLSRGGRYLSCLCSSNLRSRVDCVLQDAHWYLPSGCECGLPLSRSPRGPLQMAIQARTSRRSDRSRSFCLPGSKNKLRPSVQPRQAQERCHLVFPRPLRSQRFRPQIMLHRRDAVWTTRLVSRSSLGRQESRLCLYCCQEGGEETTGSTTNSTKWYYDVKLSSTQ